MRSNLLIALAVGAASLAMPAFADEAVTVKIVKLAIAEHNEKIGITLHRERR